MNDVTAETQTYLGIYKASIELVCESINLLAKISGFPQESADSAVLELAKQIKMKPEGRAARFLDNFLFKNGSKINFDSSLLFAEDQGVLSRVRTTVAERIMNDPGLEARTKIKCGEEYLVWVRQSDFTNSDWRLALGSFPFEWEVVGQKCIDQKQRSQKALL